YFLLTLALWLLGLSLFYGFTGSRNIKLIPLSLCVVALLTAAGPWGAYAVARRSQVARFDRILMANGLGRAGGGAVVPGRTPASLADRRELSAILRYLRSTQGPAAMARAIGVPTDSVLAWSRTPPANAASTDDPAAWHAM